MELSKTAKASMMAGTQVKEDRFATPEAKVAGILKMRDPNAGLVYVNRMDFVDALRDAYIAATNRVSELEAVNKDLAKANQELEQVVTGLRAVVDEAIKASETSNKRLESLLTQEVRVETTGTIETDFASR